VRDRLPLMALALALLVGALAVLFLRASARGEFAEPLSTYRSEPDGTRALYLLAEQSGLPVSRRHLDLEQIEGTPALVLLGAEGDLPEHEDRPDGGAHDHDDWWHERLSKYETTELLRAVEGGATLLYAVSRSHPFLDELKVSFAASADHASRELVPLSPTPYTRGVHTVQTRISGYLTAPGALPLLIDEHQGDRAVALLLERGKGRVLVIAAPTMASNSELAQDDNAAFWLSALGELGSQPGTAIAFDEFHHGFTGDRTVMSYAARFGLQWAIVQGLFALALWSLALRRMGPPRPIVESERRGSADYLLAMARIYRLGGHRAYASEALVRGATRQLQQLTRLHRTAGLDHVAEALVAQGQPGLAGLLRELRDSSRGELDEAALLTLSRKAALLRDRAQSRAAPTPGATPA